MSDFFFFTDIDLLTVQTSGNEFGPVSANPTTQYKVTSTHSASAISKAYAVCDGILLVQDAGANLVNLIIKPTKQPPFAFPKIKFLIYRGVQKNSIINGLEIAASTTNDLTTSLWASQTAKNNSAGTSDNPPKEAVGIDIITNGSIDDIFYRDNISYQLPVVKSGWSLGTFDPASFGFEIMVESIGFDPELTLVRTSDNTITVNALPGSPTQAQEFEYWHDKEAILNYIDPSAFFGSFYNFKLKVKSSDGSTANKNKNTVYDDVLVKYINKNITYLDIRNEYNHSINYFKNYGTYTNTDINIAFDNTSATVIKNYYIDAWPILRIQNSDFPNNTTNKNILRIALPDGAGDNPLPTLFISSGYLLDTYPREPKDKNKLIDLTVTSGFTNEVKLIVPNRDALATTTAISTYIKLKYFKRFDPNAVSLPVSSGTVIRASHYLDNIFQPLAMKIPFAGSSKVKTIIYDDFYFIDALGSKGKNFICKTGISNDISSIIFFLLPNIIRGSVNNFNLVSQRNDEQNLFYESVNYDYPNAIFYKSDLQIGANVKETTNVILEKSNESKNFLDFDPDNFDTISFSITEMQAISTQALLFLSKYKLYLGLENISTGIDSLNQTYSNATLSLSGFEISGNSIQVNKILTNVTIYKNGII